MFRSFVEDDGWCEELDTLGEVRLDEPPNPAAKTARTRMLASRTVISAGGSLSATT